MKKGKGNQKNSARSKKNLNNDLPTPVGADIEPETFGGSQDINMTIYRSPTEEIEVNGGVLVPDQIIQTQPNE